MNSKQRLTVAIMVAGLAPATMTAAMAEEGFMGKTMGWLTDDTYFAINLGTASSDASESDLAAQLTTADEVNRVEIDESGLAYRLSFGKRFHPNWAVEVGFADLGDIDVEVDADAAGQDEAAFLQQLADNSPVAPSGLVIDAVGDWEVGGGFSVGGRLGLFAWDSEIEYRGSDGTYRSKDDGVDGHIGVGAGWALNDNIVLRLDWERYMSTTEMDMLSLGFMYRF